MTVSASGSQPNLQNPVENYYPYQTMSPGPQPYLRATNNSVLSPSPGPPYYNPKMANYQNNSSARNSRQSSKESYQREATVV